MVAADPSDARGLLERELRRVCDRIRSLPLRLFEGAKAASVRSVAQTLAVAGQGIEERDRAEPPEWRTVPDLADHAAGDQLAVTGNDLLTALRDLPPGTPVWAPDGRRVPAADVVDQALDAVQALRRAL